MSLDAGAITGIVVGSVAGAALVLGIVCIVRHRRLRRLGEPQGAPASTLVQPRTVETSLSFMPAASRSSDRSASALVASLPTPLGAHAGRVGLVNLGNTCFMNAALQCLSHTRHLTSYFLCEDAAWEDELNVDNPLGSGGALARAYAGVLKSLWYGTHSSVPPTKFKQTLARFSPMFEGYEQHDAQELATFLLDGLHEDLNRVVGKKPYIEDLGELKEGRDEERVAAESWGHYLQRDRSVIVDLFQGQLKSTVTCAECGCQSSKFEAFMYLSLPVPPPSKAGKALTLDDCLQEFMKEEELDPDNLWRCPRCNDFRRATKRFELWKLPPLLLVHLKRFYSSGRGRHAKRGETILTPLDGLDLTPYIGGALEASHAATYSLYATCNHHGTMHGGHYTAHCRNAGFGGSQGAAVDRSKWHTLDDSTCRAVDASNVIDGSNYILFFERSAVHAPPRRQTLSRPELWPFRLSAIPKDMLPSRLHERRSSARRSSQRLSTALGAVKEGSAVTTEATDERPAHVEEDEVEHAQEPAAPAAMPSDVEAPAPASEGV